MALKQEIFIRKLIREELNKISNDYSDKYEYSHNFSTNN